jgi:hypothetical protein
MRKNQKGQTSIEYLLMVVVAITLGITFKKRMDEYFLKNPNSFIQRSLGLYRAQLGNDPRYRKFTVIQPRTR